MTTRDKKLIYLAEDDATNGALLCEALRQAGYEVVHVVNGLQLMDLLAKEIPDLILLDLIMPVKTGYEVLEEMGRNLEFSKVKVIVVTNLSLPEEAEKAKRLGAVDCLVKSDSSLKSILDKIGEYIK